MSNSLLKMLVREAREYRGLRVTFLTMTGECRTSSDPLAALESVRRARTFALHECVTRGEPELFSPLPGLRGGLIPLESDRHIQGGLLVGETLTDGTGDPISIALQSLEKAGFPPGDAARLTRRLPVFGDNRLLGILGSLSQSFYRRSGWSRPLLEENRLRTRQQRQIAEANAFHEKAGGKPVCPSEKERILLSFIKAGDRENAMRLLNEMLAAMYLTSPQLSVLRARAIELMGSLTRTAVEDSPAMEALIESNHAWMARLIQAADCESLSRVLMQALDDFIEGIYRHGYGRLHPRVNQALEFMQAHFTAAISLRDVARASGVSPFRIAHLMKEYTGKSVLQGILALRVKQAQHLLETTAKSGAEIAYETGFGDQSTFIKQFRNRTGITPARYRRSRWVQPPRHKP
ncbi:MAG: AraC family transcriptional regulator [Kiritimatiellia bacterium]